MTDTSIQAMKPETYGRVAGFLYLIIIVCGLFTEFYVRSSLIVPDDAAQTASNIMANETLFRAGFVSDLIMLLSDLALAIVFYKLLKPVSQTLALAAVATRLAMDATLGINLLNHFYAVLLLGGADYLTAFDSHQLHALVNLFLEAHGIGYSIGLVFFAVHCLILGILFYKSEYFPKLFAFLLASAFVSYMIDSFAKFLIAGYNTADYPVVMLPALIAEVSLCLWLLIKGVRIQPNQSSNEGVPKNSLLQLTD
jgi:hypothetical protein